MTQAGAGDWVSDFFRDADQLDLPLMMKWFSDDIDLRIANMPPVLGVPAVEETFKGFWSNLSGMSHERIGIVVDGDNAAQMATVTYTRKDGKVVPLPVASHLQKNAEGKLKRLWVYIDIAPLYAD